MKRDFRPQLLGRGTRPSPRQSPKQGPRHLWDHFAPPPTQASIVVYRDGTVVEGYDFEAWEMEGPEVLAFIMGGTDFRCEPGPVHDILVANGYTCGWGKDLDIYPPDDKYPADDRYPLKDTP